MYGLSAQWLVRDGFLVPDVVVLSHTEQYERLADSVPQALDATVVAGDPCFDRMVDSARQRRRYRTALGAGDSSTVIVVSSTWGRDSLFGRFPDLIAELLAELTSDDYVVAAVLHPNVWFAHGPAQIRLWLGDCLRAGLRLIPPAEGWQQTIIASDVVIGDHGAVTGYSAALGRATLLATFPQYDVVEGSAIDALGRTAIRLDVRQPLVRQIDTAIAETTADQFSTVRELTTSVPGVSGQILRGVFYQLMNLPEPDRTVLVPQFPASELVPEQMPMTAWWTVAQLRGGQEVRLRRWPADVVTRGERPPNTLDRHLVVASSHPRRDLHGNAAIVILDPTSQPEKGTQEFDEVFRTRPACVLVVAPRGGPGCWVVHRNGHAASLELSRPVPDGLDAAVCASAIYELLAHGTSWAALPDVLDVAIGSSRVRVTLRGRRSGH